ncbi:hypothetical protein BGZ60DRAFT_386647 [Tricladium varicosporioides]|nr:hypothetical protein BGZ60DRAFT_386647 [Hymenoscyphus varicosporioides]
MKLQDRLIPFSPQPTALPSQDYLIGLRGLLAIQCFLWTFLRVFAPAAVKDSSNTDGPFEHILLRKTLSVLFWNEGLIYSFFIFLSARSIAIPFINSPSSRLVASAAFRRGIRLAIPIACSVFFIQIIFLANSTTYISEFSALTSNKSISIPYEIPGALGYINSVFGVFWISRDFASQAANKAFPSQQLWILSTIYQQSYTIFMTMTIIPYTRPSWRVKALLFFVLTAWWVQSWAWFSVTALIISDVVMNMDFSERSRRGVPVNIFRKPFYFPSWILYMGIVLGGLIMQYIWTTAKPELKNGELRVHTAIYGDSARKGLNTNFDPTQPQARADNYLVIVGCILMLETYEWVQNIFTWGPFLALGRRSLAFFLMQSTIIYTAGIKLYLHLRTSQGWSDGGAGTMCLFVCLLVTIPAVEIFYRIVDVPSQWLAKGAFDWIRE